MYDKGYCFERSIKPLLSCEVPLDKIKLPVFVSTKLDGIRCLVIDSVVYSRSLKPVRNKYVQKLFGKPEYNGMDGELVVGDVYAKDVFQKTTSGVMSAEGEPDVKFYVFDICNRVEETFTARRFILHNKIENLPSESNVVMLQQHYVETLYDLQQYLEDERLKGGEGLICRNPDGKYKYGRSTPKEQLSVKLKFFEQDEFEVIGFEERMHNTNEAVKYIRNNYFLLDDERDICIPNHPIKGDVFKQYGYEVHPDEVFYDEERDTYFTPYDTDEGEYIENLNNQTIFTLRGVVLDGLLK